MFENQFNSKKTDPLVEAAKLAMQDGDLRRQAVALVNEEFGVFSRNALVREDIAAYDARLEEAYKCMKEGKPLSPKQEKMAAVAGDPKKIDAADLKALRSGKKMEEGNDGNLANNYPPYDKVTRGDVIAGRLGKDQMGGKKKMDEKKMWEGSGVSGEDPGMAVAKQAGAAQQAQTPSSTPKKTDSADLSSTLSNARSATGIKEAIMKQVPSYPATEKTMSKRQKGRDAGNPKPFANPGAIQTVPNGVQKMVSEAVTRKHFQQVADLIKSHDSQEKRNELASHHAGIFAKQNPRFDHARFHKAAGSTAHEAPKKMEEGKKWIQAAIKKKGALSKQLGVPEKKNIPVSKLKDASDEPGKLGKRARLALTLRKLHKEESDSF